MVDCTSRPQSFHSDFPDLPVIQIVQRVDVAPHRSLARLGRKTSDELSDFETASVPGAGIRFAEHVACTHRAMVGVEKEYQSHHGKQFKFFLLGLIFDFQVEELRPLVHASDDSVLCAGYHAVSHLCSLVNLVCWSETDRQ